jgi:hypothetical protein
MHDADMQACRAALSLVAPRGRPEIVRTQGGRQRSDGDWPRIDLVGAKSVQYGYLVPTGGRGELRVFPADTLTQARVLYADAGRVAALLRLRTRGWKVTPNMHFGYREKGLAWMTATADVELYTTYWLGAISRTRELDRHEWPSFVRDMLRLGFASERDQQVFDEAFTDTKRQTATPRPGLHVVKILEPPLHKTEALAAEATSRLREVLGALREPTTGLA